MSAARGRRRPATGGISAEHKAALAQGREQGRIVRRYLEALAVRASQPKRSAAKVNQRLAEIEAELPTADPLRRLHLHQERLDLRRLASAANDAGEFDASEREFVRVAKAYSERKGISYDAWRDSGVPADVLRRAGVRRVRPVSNG
jgi:hypothetical protein